MNHCCLSHSIILVLPRVVMLCGWQDFFKANWFFCKMNKEKQNIPNILFLDNILSTDVLAHKQWLNAYF